MVNQCRWKSYLRKSLKEKDGDFTGGGTRFAVRRPTPKRRATRSTLWELYPIME
jgi:hypothetical protein